MTYQLVLNNRRFNQEADEWGTIIDLHNREATAKEIEFLLREVVKTWASLVAKGVQPDST